MPATILQSRKLARDELVALFDADGSWQEVWGYFPGVDAFQGRTPLLTVTSNGTAQATESLNVNPASYLFLITTYVLSYRDSDGWLATDAADALDALDLKVRQIIRDNMGTMTTVNTLQYDTSPSQITSAKTMEGLVYDIETRGIFANLVSGAK